MKVMQINCVYMVGSTGKIVHDIHSKLINNKIESVVCYGRGKKTSNPNVYKVCTEIYAKINNLISRVTGIPYGGCLFSTLNLIRIINKEEPDVVHIQCINGFFVNIYSLISWLKKKRIKTIITLHAEFMYTANCAHSVECEKWKSGCGKCPNINNLKTFLFDKTSNSWTRMYNAFCGFEKNCIIVSVSPWLKERAMLAPILKNFNHKIVYNGIDTNNIFFPRIISNYEKGIIGAGNEPIVIHVTSSFSANPTHLKGGWYVIELAKRCPDIKFLVIGSKCTSNNLPNNIIDLGVVCNQKKLAVYYSMASVALITSRRETFSMVVAESLCCGTPVVGYCAGGPELIAIPEYSSFVEYGDLNKLEKEVRIWITKQYDKEDLVKKAQKKYGSDTMFEEYKKLYFGTFGDKICE